MAVDKVKKLQILFTLFFGLFMFRNFGKVDNFQAAFFLSICPDSDSHANSRIEGRRKFVLVQNIFINKTKN